MRTEIKYKDADYKFGRPVAYLGMYDDGHGVIPFLSYDAEGNHKFNRDDMEMLYMNNGMIYHPGDSESGANGFYINVMALIITPENIVQGIQILAGDETMEIEAWEETE